MASGGDTARYAHELLREFRALADARPTPDNWEALSYRAGVVGQLLALLLDRLDAAWHNDAQRMDNFVDVLARAVSLDPTRAVRIAKETYARYDMVHAIRGPSQPRPTNPALPAYESADARRRDYLSYVALALDSTTVPVMVSLGTRGAGSSDSTFYRIRFDPGPADSIALGDGFILLPHARTFIVEAQGLRLEARDITVVVEPNPSRTRGSVLATVFLPRAARATFGDARATHVTIPANGVFRGPTYELRLAPNVGISKNWSFFSSSAVLVSH
jgi:hypothetical protein